MEHIDLRKLKSVVDAIFNHMMDDLKIERLELKHNFYWSIASDQRNDLNHDPKPDVGSLCDDYEFLLPLVEDREQAVALMLIHVAPLLEYVGEQVGQ